MKFIIPENYNFKNKIFGIIDYKTAIFNVVYFIIVFNIFKAIVKSIMLLIVLMIIVYFPILLLSLLNTGEESFVDTLYYILKYIFKPKLYLYKKN